MNIRLLSLLLFPALASALDTSRWQYQAVIETPPGSIGIAAARLTRDIYRELVEIRTVHPSAISESRAKVMTSRISSKRAAALSKTLRSSQPCSTNPSYPDTDCS